MSNSASVSIRRDRPWHALSVRLAVAVTILGAAFWGYARTSDSASAASLSEYAPAMMRVGVSFLGGFAIGWTMRRFVKWTILIVVASGIGIFVLKKTGMIDLPWDRIESDVRDGTTWLQTQAGSAKNVLKGYLPSGAAAVVGVFLGMRR
jgi:uncharacterized membrane protein (Fun14 family)